MSNKQKITIIIDEFWQISSIKDIKIDAKLRKYIQTMPNVSFIFLGSKRSMLEGIFEYKSPLFEMAEPMTLEPICLKDYMAYIGKYLKIVPNDIEYIYEKADGETKLIQHICFNLYLRHKSATIERALIDEVLATILNTKDDIFRRLYDSFTLSQKKCIKAVAKYRANLFKKEILNELNIQKSTMQKALISLERTSAIEKESECWIIPDRSFELWCQNLD